MITILSFIFVLGILVFVHELGHFIVAKRAGIRVEQFSLGFPPKMIGKKIGETDYRISWIPLGGYVKMAGENPEEELKGEPWEFMSKRVSTRAIVVSAGPIMNFILAVLLFWGMFFFQGVQEVHTDKNIIGVDQIDQKTCLKPLKKWHKMSKFKGFEGVHRHKLWDKISCLWKTGFFQGFQLTNNAPFSSKLDVFEAERGLIMFVLP